MLFLCGCVFFFVLVGGVGRFGRWICFRGEFGVVLRVVVGVESNKIVVRFKVLEDVGLIVVRDW